MHLAALHLSLPAADFLYFSFSLPSRLLRNRKPPELFPLPLFHREFYCYLLPRERAEVREGRGRGSEKKGVVSAWQPLIIYLSLIADGACVIFRIFLANLLWTPANKPLIANRAGNCCQELFIVLWPLRVV